VVRIDVVVTDKGGRPRPGLTQDDFVVLEDGQPQKIAQFEAFTSARSPAPLPGKAKVPPQPAAEDDEASPARAIPPRRHVVLTVDDVHIETSNLLRIKKALNRFLEHELEPKTRSRSSPRAARAGSSRSSRTIAMPLQRSVDRLSVQERTVLQTGAPYLTEFQAQEIERGDVGALRVAVEEIRQEGLFQDPESAGNQAKARAREVLEESIHNSRLTLETLDSVVRSLSEIEGRKVLVLVSDGFLAGISVTSIGAFDIRRITDAGTRAGVVIYALDTRGLVATPLGRSASSRMPALASTFSDRDILNKQSEIATETRCTPWPRTPGGFLVQNTNDLTTGLRRILTDTETYYLIAYESTNTKRDGAFRKIEVRLPGVRDLRIRTRKGYFAPDDHKTHPRLLAEAPPAAAAADLAREADERRASEINRALTSVTPLAGIPVRLAADFVSLDGAGPQVVVSSYVDLRGVRFAEAGDHHLATVDAAAAVFDESGSVVGSLPPERAAMDLVGPSYEGALSKGLEYQRATPVKPGRYRVRFAAREDGEGKVGTASQWVQVPDLTNGKLTLSSLFLLEKEDGTAGGRPRPPRMVPRLARRSGAGAGSSAGRPSTCSSLLTTPGAILPERRASRPRRRSGEAVSSSLPPRRSRWLPVTAAGRRSRTRGASSSRPFGPGEYEVRIVVTDSVANEMTSRRAAFTIE
jgi:VWFA-related protein